MWVHQQGFRYEKSAGPARRPPELNQSRKVPGNASANLGGAPLSTYTPSFVPRRVEVQKGAKTQVLEPVHGLVDKSRVGVWENTQ